MFIIINKLYASLKQQPFCEGVVFLQIQSEHMQKTNQLPYYKKLLLKFIDTAVLFLLFPFNK